MPTTVNQLPVPTDTDPINQGALAMRNLAGRLAPVAAGTVTLVFAAVPVKTAAITFPVGRFTTPPAVAVTVSGTSVLYGYIAGGTTAAGTTIGGAHRDGGNATVTTGCHWVAVGF